MLNALILPGQTRDPAFSDFKDSVIIIRHTSLTPRTLYSLVPSADSPGGGPDPYLHLHSCPYHVFPRKIPDS
ncbi:hypothetical protein ASZ90_015242 [hydrocarbon metagenome]|uniref:Uncharacterized protein n=1 Tax=hydrocarbon metagenome TaxID=938273 RepID=A0A0W8F306_9ZZZZ